MARLSAARAASRSSFATARHARRSLPRTSTPTTASSDTPGTSPRRFSTSSG